VKLQRILAVAKKNLQSLRHDRRTVGFLVLMPLLMISVFGYTFGGDPKDLRVYVVNLDQTPANDSFAVSIINDISTRNTLKIVNVSSSWAIESGPSPDPAVALAEKKVKDAEIKAVLIFGANFTKDARLALAAIRNSTQAQPASLIVYIDGTNPNIVQTIMVDVQKSVQKVLVSPTLGMSSPIVVVSDLAYGQNARFIDFFAPGMMGLAAMMVTFMLSIISFVHERTASTLDRLLSTPVTEGEIVAGYAMAFGLVGLIQSVVIITAAVLLFQITIQGSVLLVLLIVFVFGVGTQGLAFLLSSLAKNEFQAIQFFPIILFPSILLSGVFWPIEAVPELIRPVSSFIPLTYAVDAMRSVMIRGWGIGNIWWDLLLLAAFASVMLALSAYGLKKRR
jgi:ABC-2 type transport system permease protein